MEGGIVVVLRWKGEGGWGKGQGVEISHIGPSMFHETNGKAIDLPEMNSSLL